LARGCRIAELVAIGCLFSGGTLTSHDQFVAALTTDPSSGARPLEPAELAAHRGAHTAVDEAV